MFPRVVASKSICPERAVVVARLIVNAKHVVVSLGSEWYNHVMVYECKARDSEVNHNHVIYDEYWEILSDQNCGITFDQSTVL